MPRATRKDKFFHLATKTKGPHKGQKMVGANYLYEGDHGSLTLQDFIDFLTSIGVSPAQVPLRGNFAVAYVKMK